MARNIMISNELYAELKRRKGTDKSFSETIKDALEPKKVKTGKDLLKFVGILKGDTEYDEIMKEAKKRWKEWDERYRKEEFA